MAEDFRYTPIRIRINGGGEHLPFAKSVLEQLDKLRKNMGVSFLSKTITLDDNSKIFMQSNGFGINRLTIDSGGGDKEPYDVICHVGHTTGEFTRIFYKIVKDKQSGKHSLAVVTNPADNNNDYGAYLTVSDMDYTYIGRGIHLVPTPYSVFKEKYMTVGKYFSLRDKKCPAVSSGRDIKYKNKFVINEANERDLYRNLSNMPYAFCVYPSLIYGHFSMSSGDVYANVFTEDNGFVFSTDKLSSYRVNSGIYVSKNIDDSRFSDQISPSFYLTKKTDLIEHNFGLNTLMAASPLGQQTRYWNVLMGRTMYGDIEPSNDLRAYTVDTDTPYDNMSNYPETWAIKNKDYSRFKAGIIKFVDLSTTKVSVIKIPTNEYDYKGDLIYLWFYPQPFVELPTVATQDSNDMILSWDFAGWPDYNSDKSGISGYVDDGWPRAKSIGFVLNGFEFYSNPMPVSDNNSYFWYGKKLSIVSFLTELAININSSTIGMSAIVENKTIRLTPLTPSGGWIAPGWNQLNQQNITSVANSFKLPYDVVNDKFTGIEINKDDNYEKAQISLYCANNVVDSMSGDVEHLYKGKVTVGPDENIGPTALSVSSSFTPPPVFYDVAEWSCSVFDPDLNPAIYISPGAYQIFQSHHDTAFDVIVYQKTLKKKTWNELLPYSYRIIGRINCPTVCSSLYGAKVKYSNGYVDYSEALPAGFYHGGYAYMKHGMKGQIRRTCIESELTYHISVNGKKYTLPYKCYIREYILTGNPDVDQANMDNYPDVTSIIWSNPVLGSVLRAKDSPGVMYADIGYTSDGSKVSEGNVRMSRIFTSINNKKSKILINIDFYKIELWHKLVYETYAGFSGQVIGELKPHNQLNKPYSDSTVGGNKLIDRKWLMFNTDGTLDKDIETPHYIDKVTKNKHNWERVNGMAFF